MNININDKPQREKLSKLLEELNLRNLVAEGDYDDIGYITTTSTMYIPLENRFNLKDNFTVVLAISGFSVYYHLTDAETGEETKYDYAELLKFAEIQKEKHICEICGVCDYDEVGIATGENGVEIRVCENCDVDGSDYNGWGDKDESDDEEDTCECCGKPYEQGNLRQCDMCDCVQNDDGTLSRPEEQERE